MLIDEVETLWSEISDADDWGPLEAHMKRIETARQALALDR
jgi:hypothetical protein